MLKWIPVAALVALLCGLALFGLAGLAASGDAAIQPMFIVAAVTLFVSVAAAVLAILALARANAFHARLQYLARSVDAAMRDLAAERTRDMAALTGLDARVAQQLERLSISVPALQEAEDDTDPPAARSDNVVPHPATRRPRQGQANAQPLPAMTTDLGSALQRAVAGGTLELSLQPIIAIAEGAAAGFEVYAHVQADDGPPVDIRRLAEPVAGLSQAAFERLLVISAAEAARRRLGTASESMPLHIAVSEALLADQDEFATVVEMVERYPTLMKSIVLSVPAAAVETQGSHTPALNRLMQAGIRIAVEGWAPAGKALESLKRSAVSFLKLPAERLLERPKARKSEVDAATLLEAAGAASITVIATDVRSDDDAVGLIDLGIGLMTGERFSGPRRLKADDGRAGRMART